MPSPRYLDSPEYAFISTMLWMSRWSREQLAPHGLQGVHFHTMARLDERPGLSQRELGEAIHRDAPATSRVLDEMIGMELVERRVDPDDRRRRKIFLTRKGKRLFAKLHTGFLDGREAIGIDIDEADAQALWRVARHLQERFRAALEGGDAHEREVG